MIDVPSRAVLATPDDMHAYGVELGRMLRAGDLLVLTGPLGAGKTTLTRGIGEGLGVRGPITSPTFVLARTHPSLGFGAPLVHVDAYRLDDAMQLDDLDIDFAGSVVVVEWGRGMLEGVAESWLELDIERPTGAVGASELHGMAARSASGDSQSLQLTERAGHADEAGAAAEAMDDVAAERDEPRTVSIRRVVADA